MIEITSQDEHRWQLDAIGVLTSLAKDAFRTGLPALDWHVGVGRRLLGRPPAGPDADKRAAFRAWVTRLDAIDRKSRDADGTVRLWAKAEVHGKDGPVFITLHTQLDD